MPTQCPEGYTFSDSRYPPAVRGYMFCCLRYWFLLLTSIVALGQPSSGVALGAEIFSDQADSLHFEWGGHVRCTAQAAFWEAETPQATLGPRTAVDSTAELRFMNRTFWGQDTNLQTHYLARFEHRDSLQTKQRLLELADDHAGLDMLQLPEHVDDRHFFDFSHTLHQKGRTRIVHSLDRLNLTLSKAWGTLRLGRQAVSWGNGLVFHPMDLFNPFSPTEILTDYKAGEDMASVNVSVNGRGELHLLAVPRRTENGSVHWDQSSMAGKMNLFSDVLQVDLMAAHHFDAAVFGLGLTGNAGNAAWRTDVTWTKIESGQKYFSAATNLDRSWVWGRKNWYGLLELYYQGLGEDTPEEAVQNSDLMQRLNRGEVFVLSTMYLSSALEVEISPLMRLNLTGICNLRDASYLVQPSLRWDLADDLELIAGATGYAGSGGTEFGGFELSTPRGALTIAPSNSVFAWLTAYF